MWEIHHPAPDRGFGGRYTAERSLIGGRVVNNLEPKDRDIAMVFQNYAIYPHMTVRKNIGFGLRTAKMSKLGQGSAHRRSGGAFWA